MDRARSRRAPWALLAVGGGIWLNWLVAGPVVAGMTVLGVALFVGLPFWLAAVYGKPHMKRPQ